MSIVHIDRRGRDGRQPRARVGQEVMPVVGLRGGEGDPHALSVLLEQGALEHAIPVITTVRTLVHRDQIADRRQLKTDWNNGLKAVQVDRGSDPVRLENAVAAGALRVIPIAVLDRGHKGRVIADDIHSAEVADIAQLDAGLCASRCRIVLERDGIQTIYVALAIGTFVKGSAQFGKGCVLVGKDLKDTVARRHLRYVMSSDGLKALQERAGSLRCELAVGVRVGLHSGQCAEIRQGVWRKVIRCVAARPGHVRVGRGPGSTHHLDQHVRIAGGQVNPGVFGQLAQHLGAVEILDHQRPGRHREGAAIAGQGPYIVRKDGTQHTVRVVVQCDAW